MRVHTRTIAITVDGKLAKETINMANSVGWTEDMHDDDTQPMSREWIDSVLNECPDSGVVNVPKELDPISVDDDEPGITRDRVMR